MPKKARSNQEEWVLSLNTTIKDVGGLVWRVAPTQNGQFKLFVKMSDGSQKARVLPIPWDRNNAKRIQETVDLIFRLYKEGEPIGDAITGGCCDWLFNTMRGKPYDADPYDEYDGDGNYIGQDDEVG